MTIWAFGNSFLADYSYSDKKNWVNRVGLKLNHNVENLALRGCSVDYMYSQFSDVRNRIKDNDILLIGVTHLFRKWFIKDRPGLTQLTDSRVLKYLNDSNLMTAVKYYYLYLEREDIDKIHLTNFLYNVAFITQEKNLCTLVIPCMRDSQAFLKPMESKYPQITFIQGCLADVNEKEYDFNFFRKIHNTFLNDGKCNHLLWTNHEILANKVVDNIVNKIPIDLYKEFKQDLITFDSINDTNFILTEFNETPDYGW